MSSIKSWLSPLIVFCVGELMMLVVFAFLPSYDSAISSVNTTTASTIRTFAWGWSWLMSTGVMRWLLLTFCQALILFVTGWVFIQSRD